MKSPLSSKQKKIYTAAGSVLFAAALLCFVLAYLAVNCLQSQYEYKRWRGENELEFSQVSCFVPVGQGVSKADIYTFRSAMLTKLTEASIATDPTPFTDAWSCSGTMKVFSDKASGTASVTAVGGDFFDFHPLTLVSGHYISDDTLMKDEVVLDRELAWFLFGSDEVVGLMFNAAGVQVTVAGVVERETDSSSSKAYTDGMGLFMNYDTYCDIYNGLTGGDIVAKDLGYVSGAGTAITCYEIVLPNPVKNFAINAVKDKFPIGSGVIYENTGRFSVAKLFPLVFKLGSRSVQKGVPYPYWENAALYAESKASYLMVLGTALIVFPALLLLSFLLYRSHLGGTRLREDVLPAAKETAEEKLRARQRKQWERAHPGQR